jgi:hypothetical protein
MPEVTSLCSLLNECVGWLHLASVPSRPLQALFTCVRVLLLPLLLEGHS